MKSGYPRCYIYSNRNHLIEISHIDYTAYFQLNEKIMIVSRSPEISEKLKFDMYLVHA